MKKTCLLLALAATTIMSCTKSTTNNNNYGSGLPPFAVNGVTDVTLRNSSVTSAYLNLSVQYLDSSQQTVNLSLSALPPGITMDTSWITSGIPTYNSSLTFYDTTAAGGTPGIYPMVLTATTATGQKTYKFNIKVQAAPPCISQFLGAYTSCTTSCSGSGFPYADSVYADPGVANRVWFTNFGNTGHLGYADFSCTTGEFTIPAQTIGGVIYNGNGYGYSHFISMNLLYGAGSSCSFQDN